MANKIERLHSVTPQYTATATAATSAQVPFGASASGMLFVTALATATKIVWHAAMEPNGTAYPLLSGGSAVETSVAAGNAYAIPDAALGAPFLVPVADAGTVTFRVCVKG